MRITRLARFAWALARGNILKYSLLCLLVGTGVLVFFTLSELSRASQVDIDNAVASELGDQGVYTVEFSQALHMPGNDLIRLSSQALKSTSPVDITYVEIIAGVNPQCPPENFVGEQSILLFLNAKGSQKEFKKSDVQVDFAFCLGGQVVPVESIRDVGDDERRVVGEGFVIDSRYAPLARVASNTNSRWLMIVNVGRAMDVRNEIEQSLWRAFNDAILQNGLVPEAALSVNRVDVGGDIRAASQGIRFVYNVISWMTLGLVAIAVLVAELFLVRDRMWLLGLSRAVGARRSDLVTLVVLDVFGVISMGVLFAVVLSIGLAPVFEAFSQSAFQTSLILFRVDLLPILLTFLVASVALGAIYPALRVLRLDPAETAERR